MIFVENIIIGAGISGLLLGKKLSGQTIILEKSRGLGGRIANRRIHDLGFDHGAPYLKDDDSFRELLKENGINYVSSESGLFTKGSMTQIPKMMANNLLIEKSTRAEFLKRENNKWIVETDNQKVFAANNVIITAPLPQALELLDKNNISVEARLRDIHYSKAVMALIVTEEVVTPDQMTSSLHSVISMKERELHPRGFVARASEKISDQMFDLSDGEILDFLVEEFLKCFSVRPKLEYFELKKWRYVLPEKSLLEDFVEVSSGLFLIGDAFRHPDIRGSITSATLLAEKLN